MTFKQRSEALLFKIIILICKCLPRCLCVFKGRTFGLLLYLFDKKHRNTALKNLDLAFGENKTYGELKKIARSSFKHFGEFFFSMIHYPSADSSHLLKFIKVEGEDFLDDALKQNKGAVLFSAHYGSWEIAPSFLSLRAPLNIVVRPLDNPAIERMLNKIRLSVGAKVISKFNASKQILRALSKNEMIAILMDQNVLRSQAVFVDFFGKKAATTPGPAIFHLRTGAPLIPVFCYPVKRSEYLIKISQPLNFAPGDSMEEDILKITQVCTGIIEEQIKEEPRFWLWFHDRWRSRPHDPDTK